MINQGLIYLIYLYIIKYMVRFDRQYEVITTITTFKTNWLPGEANV